MRHVLLATLLLIFTNPVVADDRAVKAALIDRVFSGLRENDLRLGPVKARLRLVGESSFKFDARPAPVPPPPPVPKRPGVPVDTTSVLTVNPHPVLAVDWTAQLAGENRRFEVQGSHGRETWSLDRAGITRHESGKAFISPWSDWKSYISQMQYDPREIGFLMLAETMLQLRQLDRFESARIINAPDGAETIELTAKSLVPDMSVVIECSSRLNYLPKRLYYLRQDLVSAVADMTYQQVRSEPTPAWFLKSAIRRMAVIHKNKSPDDKNWGQTITVEVTDLQLDAQAPPPRDVEQSLPPGTEIQNRIPQPPPPPVPEEPIVGNFSVLSIVVMAIAAVAILLFLYGMSLRRSEN